MTPNVMALLCAVSGLPWAIMSCRWHCTLSDLPFIFHFRDNISIVIALLTIVVFFTCCGHSWPALSATHATAGVEVWTAKKKKKCNQRNRFTNQFCYKLHNLAWNIEVGFEVHKSTLIRAVSWYVSVVYFLFVTLRTHWQSIWNHNGFRYTPYL